MRILFISHSHPALKKGGAEIAAYTLHEACKAQRGFQSWFLGCGDAVHGREGPAITQPFDNDDYLYCASDFDWFKLANRDIRFPTAFEALLRELQPDILHFHHIAHIGVDAFRIARRTLPNCRIIVTLHEYLAICHHYGQMVTTDRQLCHAAGLKQCHTCFPQHDASDFFLRQLYIQGAFDLVDRFIAPSHFLAQRYTDWGLPAARMTVIENLIRPAATVRRKARDSTMLRIGYFGQISWLKGCNVLLDAAALLHRRGVDGVHIDISGDYSGQPVAFQAEFTRKLAEAGPNVTFHGPYRNDDIDRLMSDVDAVVVPSVWWENSPIVIQEARRNRKMVLCSDIGGMAEKVADGVDGHHFRAGCAMSLAVLIAGLNDITMQAAVSQTFHKLEQPWQAHKAIYRELLR